MSEKWDKRFMQVAILASTWSKDPSTKVGAAAVYPATKEVRSIGYNGFPRGVADDARYENRELKYKLIVHAEKNLCFHAARTGTSLEGCTLYTTFSPCTPCAGAVIQAGFKEVVYLQQHEPDRWRDDLELGRSIMEEAGLCVRGLALEGELQGFPCIDVLHCRCVVHDDVKCAVRYTVPSEKRFVTVCRRSLPVTSAVVTARVTCPECVKEIIEHESKVDI